MNEIFKAFELIQAEESLKENTKKYLASRQVKKPRLKAYYRAALTFCLAAVLVLSLLGVRSTHAEAAYIELDSMARIGLSINRWNEVIDAVGLDEEGQRLIETLKVTGMNYQEAVDEILNSDTFCDSSGSNNRIRVKVHCKDQSAEETLKEEVVSQCHSHMNRSSHHGQAVTGIGGGKASRREGTPAGDEDAAEPSSHHKKGREIGGCHE